MSDDSSYYAARAAEELRRAMESGNSKIRGIHFDLAARYSALAGTNETNSSEVLPEAEQIRA